MTDSPTFVATFNDGTQTRMTVWHDPGRKTLNLDRGIRLRSTPIARASNKSHR
jgi:hypothetical protein